MIPKQNVQEWLERAARAALDVPAAGREAEAWKVRNLAEVCLFTIAFGGLPSPVDTAVAELDEGLLGPASGRLLRLRQCLGALPSQYEVASSEPPPVSRFAKDESDAAELLSVYADSLEGGEVTASDIRSVQNGLGGRIIGDHATARGLGKYAHKVIDTSLPTDLLWRTWTYLPWTGPVALVPDELLDPATMDIWWGIHNGFHLDHMAGLAAQGSDPMRVEFGEGMLISESLTMVGEILSGAKARLAGRPRHMAVVADGISERIRRHPASPMKPRESDRISRDEFAWLPTVASAYVAGPLKLIAANFESDLIPKTITEVISTQWTTLEGQDNSLRILRRGAQDVYA
ncbi:hypothetical protein [Arthrobacter sp. 4R501]|uniref:hypothetical protein n=1 Tax=Arthrobacter sp. 4R501 TaxID=2058886 RepID=UPI000CE38853|nr:hypothetical protein [Arthrobacter sp. 4R501]